MTKRRNQITLLGTIEQIERRVEIVAERVQVDPFADGRRATIAWAREQVG